MEAIQRGLAVDQSGELHGLLPEHAPELREEATLDDSHIEDMLLLLAEFMGRLRSSSDSSDEGLPPSIGSLKIHGVSVSSSDQSGGAEAL